MACFPLGLHLHEGDLPGRLQVFTSEGRVVASVEQRINDDAELPIFGTPRVFRAWAEALLELAEEAVRREDAMTDEPLPFEVA